MASTAPFVLSRATASDMDEIVDLQYDCFPGFVREVFMGCFSKNDLPRVRDLFIDKMQQDPNDVWIKVVDKLSGNVVAASNWKLYVNGPSSGGVKDEAPEWLEGELREKSKAMMKKVNEKRAEAMTGPFIRMLGIEPAEEMLTN